MAPKSEEASPSDRALLDSIKKYMGIEASGVTRRKVFVLYGFDDKDAKKITKELFVDQITERVNQDYTGFGQVLQIGKKPLVANPEARTAEEAAASVLGRELKMGEGISTYTQYLFNDVTSNEAKTIGNQWLANPLIESVRVMSPADIHRRGIPVDRYSIGGGKVNLSVGVYDLDVSPEELMRISQKGSLSLNQEEMQAIAEYFRRPEVMQSRREAGLEKEFRNKPTDAELEAIAQTWSEHCKHKIFNALINYTDENGRTETIDSIFKTYIKNPSMEIGKRLGFVLSDFSDNAGIVIFNERILVLDKIETHNSPSALDPFGGAITGILGVIRDILGAGIGADPKFNIFAYCFGNPNYDGKIPNKAMHPRRTRDGVHHGVSAGGNESGIPLAIGGEHYHKSFNFRPLVFCGTVGTMPREINGKPTHLKSVDEGDRIVMLGGKVGKDGIHGATFSSTGLSKDSPTGAVQIGDSITQKKMTDFLMEARDRGLYKSITDNGAGGLSSSVGEMGSKGFVMDLSKVPLKYSGLTPWEILISESQERMTLAVDPVKINEFLELAKKWGVEASVLGNFQNSGKFHVKYGGKTIAYLDADFLHDGVPRMKLDARFHPKIQEEPTFERNTDMDKTIIEMLKRLNISSKESSLRRYDHEVKGLSVVKPLIGRYNDVPSNATIQSLEYGSYEGLIFSQALNPRYSAIDTYHMVTSVMDEAVRKIISVGGKLSTGKETPFYGLDNFCWNLSKLDTKEEREHKIAELVRANKALRDYYTAMGFPLISGKDSMSNAWEAEETVDGKTVKKQFPILPTLLFSARGKIDDVTKAVTMDVKAPGDLVYVVGETKDELGGSEYYSYMGEKTNGEEAIGRNVPKVNLEEAKKTYDAMSQITDEGIAASIHTPTIGGLGIALAQSAFAGGCGMEIDLDKVVAEKGMAPERILFSQTNGRFIVTVPPERRGEFEKIMEGVAFAEVGQVTESQTLKISNKEGTIVNSDINALRAAWKETA